MNPPAQIHLPRWQCLRRGQCKKRRALDEACVISPHQPGARENCRAPIVKQSGFDQLDRSPWSDHGYLDRHCADRYRSQDIEGEAPELKIIVPSRPEVFFNRMRDEPEHRSYMLLGTILGAADQ